MQQNDRQLEEISEARQKELQKKLRSWKALLKLETFSQFLGTEVINSRPKPGNLMN